MFLQPKFVHIQREPSALSLSLLFSFLGRLMLCCLTLRNPQAAFVDRCVCVGAALNTRKASFVVQYRRDYLSAKAKCAHVDL